MRPVLTRVYPDGTVIFGANEPTQFRTTVQALYEVLQVYEGLQEDQDYPTQALVDMYNACRQERKDGQE